MFSSHKWGIFFISHNPSEERRFELGSSPRSSCPRGVFGCRKAPTFEKGMIVSGSTSGLGTSSLPGFTHAADQQSQADQSHQQAQKPHNSELYDGRTFVTRQDIPQGVQDHGGQEGGCHAPV